MIDQSQRKAAQVAAIVYPLTLVVSITAFFRLYIPLVVANDPSATARHLVAREQTLRIYLAAMVAYGLGVIVVLTALYAVLRPVNQGVATFAAIALFELGISVWLPMKGLQPSRLVEA